MFPDCELNQYAAFAWRPAGRIAARSLIETPITFDRPFVLRRNSSPSVEAISLRGLEATSVGPPPRRTAPVSLTLVTRLPVSRSGHSLATIPVSAGHAPVIMVAWPGAV